jgi:EAL domain-containing protein (putative c-di-GMP-specific phosphodiesterase class I)
MADGQNSRLAHLLRSDGTPSRARANTIEKILQSVRTHLSMDVAFVAQFAEGRRIFRQISAGPRGAPMQVGDSNPLEESYCQRVVDGRLPELIQDASAIPEAAALPVTAALPIGAHLSVPIRLRDGSIYGTFCCFSHAADRTLNPRDLDFMRAFADLTAEELDAEGERVRDRERKIARISGVISNGEMSPVFQPIFHLSDHSVAGVECLSRFTGTPRRSPDLWFAEAAEVGMATLLELAAIRQALQALPPLPRHVYVGINVGPETLLDSDGLADALQNFPAHQIMLELTEHAQVDDYTALSRALERHRESGVRLAIDDAGAGYASFRHILALKPDRIKLDISLIRSIDIDLAKRALAAALIAFSHETGSRIVAEGVETGSELSALKNLGVDCAQGYYLARPMTLKDLTNVSFAAQALNARVR